VEIRDYTTIDTYHTHSVKLLQTRHVLQQQADDTATLDRLDRSCEQVGSDRLIVLQYEETERLTQDLVRLFVVATKYRIVVS
jgi:hypothetical protein